MTEWNEEMGLGSTLCLRLHWPNFSNSFSSSSCLTLLEDERHHPWCETGVKWLSSLTLPSLAHAYTG